MTARNIVLLGSTGSIGESTCDVVRAAPDRLRLTGLAAGKRWEKLEQQALAHGVTRVVVDDPAGAEQLQRRHPDWQVGCGIDDVIALATAPGTDFVVGAMVGAAGARPVLAALQAGISVGLANKETLVMAGETVMRAARASGARILPIDSEHSALFQCLEGERAAEVARLILTASGGPFLNFAGDLRDITLADALAHPKWSMGAKVTIDSSTLMNKGLEVIEAHHLFGFAPAQLSVVVHPQSIVHSLVEFVDGNLKAQLGVTDMRLPIAYALHYPERVANPFPKLKLVDLEQLTFRRADAERFPCLRLAFDAVKAGGTAPAILNAANEVAVQAFMDGTLTFPGIPRLVEQALGMVTAQAAADWDAVAAADAAGRAAAREWLARERASC